MKTVIVVLVIAFIVAVGYNVISIIDLIDGGISEQNEAAIGLEVASRIGLFNTLGMVLVGSDVAQNPRFLREYVNVLFDWYAPVQFYPVLSVSREIVWLIIRDVLNN